LTLVIMSVNMQGGRGARQHQSGNRPFSDIPELILLVPRLHDLASSNDISFFATPKAVMRSSFLKDILGKFFPVAVPASLPLTLQQLLHKEKIIPLLSCAVSKGLQLVAPLAAMQHSSKRIPEAALQTLLNLHSSWEQLIKVVLQPFRGDMRDTQQFAQAVSHATFGDAVQPVTTTASAVDLMKTVLQQVDATGGRLCFKQIEAH
jgi:hypothetical protein